MPVYNLLVGSGGSKAQTRSKVRPTRRRWRGEGALRVPSFRTRYTNFTIGDFITNVMSQFRSSTAR